jgi:hypothetical protein
MFIKIGKKSAADIFHAVTKLYSQIGVVKYGILYVYYLLTVEQI